MQASVRSSARGLTRGTSVRRSAWVCRGVRWGEEGRGGDEGCHTEQVDRSLRFKRSRRDLRFERRRRRKGPNGASMRRN
eukprot:2352448-Pleurochrysis_carterae.AAC.3